MSDLDAIRLAAAAPRGLERAADPSATTAGVVRDVNRDAGLVRVSVRQSDGTWVAAVPGRYVNGEACRVLLDPFTGGRAVLVLPAAAVSPIARTTLTAVTATRATVAWEAGHVTVPCLPWSYTVGAPVWVGLDDWGVPVICHGPAPTP